MLYLKNSSWQNQLKSEFDKPYFVNLMQKIEEEYQNNIIFPPKELLFNAFEKCSFDDLKVVIIGQDPYHGIDKNTGKSEANGLCFSVDDNVKIPSSLRNIYEELKIDLGNYQNKSTNLDRWSTQGVLLLNATLTVEKDKANSHKKLDWQLFTDAVIHQIASKKKHVVFLLWGKFAQSKAKIIEPYQCENNLKILQCGHPSFANSHKQWFGNKHFSKTNTFFKQNNLGEIDW